VVDSFDRRLVRLELRLRRLIGEGPAALFHDACRIASDDLALRGQASLAWHCAREIESAIFQALNPVAPYDEEANKERKRAAQCDAIIQQLGIPEGDAAIRWWRTTSLHSVAHRNNLGPARPLVAADWQMFLAALEVILDRFEARYGELLHRLDALLRLSPARAGRETRKLLCSVPPTGTATALRHFFERADESWLNVLPACILDNPPPPEPVPDQPGYVSYPVWHAAAYLAKVSAQRPQAVHAKVLRILDLDPRNPRVHVDLIRAAEHFPTRLLASWADAQTEWVRRQDHLPHLLPHALTGAVERLATTGLEDQAFAMAEALLALGDGAPGRLGEPALRMRDYDYQRAVRTIGRTLANISARRAAEVLARLLAEALAQNHPGEAAKWSSVWLPSLDEASGRGRETTLGAIALTLRDTLDRALSDGEPVDWFAALLHPTTGTSSVIRRLLLHVTSTRRDADPELALRLLTDSSSYTNETWDELLALLASISADVLSPHKARVSDAVSQSQLQAGMRDYVIELVGAIESGDTPQPLPTRMSRISWSPVDAAASPASAGAMRRWGVSRTVRYLTEREAHDEGEVPAPTEEAEALEREFSQVVSSQAAKYSRAARRLVPLGPRYAERALYALRERAKQGDRLNWNGVVRLANFVLNAGSAWAGAEWAAARQALAWLLLTGVEDSFRISRSSQAAMWSVLGALLHDPMPTDRDEARRLGEDDDTGLLQALANIRLNTVRPLAVYLTIAYAVWWVQQRTPRRPMPSSARRLLEEVVRDDGSQAVRSAIGERTSTLFWLDRTWFIGLLPEIYPVQSDRADLRRAAWVGYLTSPTVYLDLFEHLVVEYGHAVERLADGAAGDEQERLSEHLFLLARAGTIGPDSPDGLLRRFVEVAPPVVARQAIQHAGWMLWTTRDSPLEPDEAARLTVLWEAVVTWVEEAVAPKSILSGFGWWFASRHFDGDWSLAELEKLASADVPLDDLHVVWERLLALVDADPSAVARTCDAIIAREMNNEELYGSELAELARRLRRSRRREVVRNVRSLVSRMRSRGFATFPD
jgi:hypothetical protein